MGHNIPTEPFVIDPAITYTVVLNFWQNFAGEFCPGTTPDGTFTTDLLGATIITWLDGNNECTYDILFGPPGLFLVERIASIVEA